MTLADQVPDGWVVKRLSEVAHITAGGDVDPLTGSPVETDFHPHPVYANAIERSAIHSYSSVARNPAGAVTITARGTLGYAVYREKPFTAIGRLLVVWPNDRFDGRFLAQYLNARVSFAVESTGVPQLTGPQAGSYEVMLPTNLPEQQAIAAALSDADGVVAGLERVIAKKRLIKQGAMQDLLTARRRLPGFSGEWSSMTLFEMADNNKKNFDDGDWIEAEHIAPSGIRLIQTGNVGIGEFLNSNRKYIFEESFSRLKCKEVHPGDVLICRLAEPPGRACIVPDLGEDRMITSVDVTIFRPNRATADRKLLTEFMSQSSWFARVDEASGGTTRKRIARSRLGRMTLLMPSTKEQQALSELFADMDAEIQTLESRLAKARAVKEGMMQNLLTGRVRLV